MKRVTELPALIGISKQAIYKKLSQPKYQPFIKLVDKVKHITNEGFELLCIECSVKQEVNRETEVMTKREQVLIETIANQRKEEIDRLTTMLTERDKEVTNLHRMLENQQILTLNAQAEVKRLSQPQEQEPIVAQQEEQKGFWQRIFSKV